MPSIKVNDQIHHITDIDRSQCSRLVPMRVLCLGLSRTGSESLMEALRLLGYYEAYHGYHATINNPRDCEMWMRALRAKYEGVGKPFGRKEFDQLLGHCQAVSDLPALCFAPELIEAYPEAKVILTVRDVDEWHDSVVKFCSILSHQPLHIISAITARLNVLLRSRFRWARPVSIYGGLQIFTDNFAQHYRDVYAEHYKMVEALVPPDRLLHYHVKEGWEPLCRFLGQPVPRVPMPKRNKLGDMRERWFQILAFNLRELGVTVLRVAAYVALGVVVGTWLGVGDWIGMTWI